MAMPLTIWLLAAMGLALLFLPYAGCALVGLSLAVVALPLYAMLAGSLVTLGFGHRKARHLGALLTEAVALLLIVGGLVLPALLLYHNRAFFGSKGMAIYEGARQWSRSEAQSLGKRMAIPGFFDPEDGDAGAKSPLPAAQDGLKVLLENPGPLFPWAMRSAAMALNIFVRLMVLLLIMHVCLLHGAALWGHILQHARPNWRSILMRLGSRAADVLRAVYLVHGLTAFAAFMVAVPVFWVVVHPPYFFLAAVMAGLFQFIPFLGSAALVALMTLYYFASGHMVQAWQCLLMAFPLVVGLPDLVIRPWLGRAQGRISGVTMLIGFLAGWETMGPAGFVLGPVVLDLFVTFTGMMLYGPDFRSPAFVAPGSAWNKKDKLPIN